MGNLHQVIFSCSSQTVRAAHKGNRHIDAEAEINKRGHANLRITM